MHRFFPYNRNNGIACIIVMAISSSPARGDVLPGADMNDTGPSTGKLSSPTLESTSDGSTPRQHVKHLRAHKKVGVDTSTDSNPASEKTNKPQSAETKAVPVEAGKKLSEGNLSSPALAKAKAKRQMITARPRQVELSKAPTNPQTGSQNAGQRDFFSDIFGGDD